MKDQDKTTAQLIDELTELRQRVSELEALGAKGETEEELETERDQLEQLVEQRSRELKETSVLLQKEMEERKRAEEALQKRTKVLGERMKELDCFYGMGEIVERPDLSLEETIQAVVDLIPGSWQYPEVTAVRAILEDQEFKTKNFGEAVSKQAIEIAVDRERVLFVEVCYMEERPESDEGPFLKEERRLLNAIAERLARIVERMTTTEALRESQRELSIRDRISQVFLTVPDEEMYGDVLQVVLEWTESRHGVFGYIDEDGTLVVPTMTREVWDKCRVPDKTLRFPRDTWGDSTWPRCIREKRPIYLNELSAKAPEGHIPMLKHVSMPILYHGEAIGLFQVANKETDYSEKDVRMLQAIAEYIGPILNARLQEDREEKERERWLTELETKNTELQRYADTVLELSTPVIKLWKGVLLLPLVGVIDTARSQLILEQLLQAIVAAEARVAILDVTGVPLVDTTVAKSLMTAVSSAQMLGGEVIITGLSPETAQTLTKLAIDFSSIRFRGTLEAGILDALSMIGLAVVPKE